MSVCVLKVSDSAAVMMARAGGWLDRAIPQIGSMIGRLVRVEDTAARLGPELFALALPATNQASARAAGERIAAVIACTAFDSGGDRPPFVAEFDIGVAEVHVGESAAKALEVAAAKAMQKQAS
jgi:two-component system cell cycle response regulator PopA